MAALHIPRAIALASLRRRRLGSVRLPLGLEILSSRLVDHLHRQAHLAAVAASECRTAIRETEEYVERFGSGGPFWTPPPD
jgi:hypothetical protein